VRERSGCDDFVGDDLASSTDRKATASRARPGIQETLDSVLLPRLPTPLNENGNGLTAAETRSKRREFE